MASLAPRDRRRDRRLGQERGELRRRIRSLSARSRGRGRGYSGRRLARPGRRRIDHLQRAERSVATLPRATSSSGSTCAQTARSAGSRPCAAHQLPTVRVQEGDRSDQCGFSAGPSFSRPRRTQWAMATASAGSLLPGPSCGRSRLTRQAGTFSPRDPRRPAGGDEAAVAGRVLDADGRLRAVLAEPLAQPGDSLAAVGDRERRDCPPLVDERGRVLSLVDVDPRRSPRRSRTASAGRCAT